jgi:penicillin-binding protein 2
MWQSDHRELSSGVFSRRAFIVLFGKFLIMGAIIIRLFILQIFKAKEYKTLSDKNSIKFIIIHPRRGAIKDVHGRPLAYNKEVYKIYFYKQRGKANEAIFSSAFDLLDNPSKPRASLLKKVKTVAYLQPVIIEDNASWDSIARIEAETHRLPGVFVEKSFMRYYPLKETLAHIIGYIGLPNKKEISTYELQYAKEIKIGKAGVEKRFNPSLLGKFGAKRVEVNAHRAVVRDLAVEPGSPGADVNLTINSDIQTCLHKLLPKSNSAAAVIDLPTGNLLAMCSLPAFNPNLFSMEFDEAEWRSLMQNKHSPFLNKVIEKAYPPGSAWKVVTSLAILEAGIDPEEKIFCTGSIQIGNRVFKCAHQTAHGQVNAYNAIPLSCNCYFYKMGIKAGVENIYKVARTLGFGQKIGIELEGEVQGLNPNKLWKAKSLQENWTHGDTANTSIGQGFVLTTPLQLLMMTARVASGKTIFPSILKDHHKNFAPTDLPFKKENLNLVRAGLSDVMNNPRGTSFHARIIDKQFAMAGKTGTAQVMSKDTSRGGGLRSHSVFIGYAPVHDPKYAAVVVADNAGWGSAIAAPIARDILLFAQKNAITTNLNQATGKVTPL